MKVYIVVFLVTIIHNQLIASQVLRQPTFNLINRPMGEKIIESGNFINPPTLPTVINEPPCNNIVPIPNNIAAPTTTIITDCSPAICQNLANTIQLMIVCNLLQNSQSSDLALQLAGPLLTEAMSSPALSCGCNQLSPNLISPSVITPNMISPSVISPNIISPNVAAPNYPPNIYSPNIISPNVAAPNYPPNIYSPNIISPNLVSIPPRVVTPTNSCPCNNIVSANNIGTNLPLAGPANTNGLLNTIMSMLGNIQG